MGIERVARTTIGAVWARLAIYQNQPKLVKITPDGVVDSPIEMHLITAIRSLIDVARQG